MPIRKSKEKRSTNRRSRKHLFLRTFAIACLSFSLMVFAGLITLYNATKPPDLVEDPAPEYPVEQETAFVVPEGVHEDTLIGDGSPAPAGFTWEDRKQEFYTFLIFGVDKGVNTDTIMVAAYDGILGQAYIIGIPRDSKVNVKRNVKKINAAYPAGTLNGGGKDGGIEQLKREVKTIIGFVPDYTVCVDFKAFEGIVDAVGGVSIDVPYDMIYDDDVQDLHINIKQGLKVLNGKEALQFARYRRGNNDKDTISDYQRIENQQVVIKALIKELLTPASLLKIPEFRSLFMANVHTDLPLDALLYFGDQLLLKKVTSVDALETYTMPTIGTSGAPDYYEFLDQDAIVELINRTINPYVKDIEVNDLDIAK